MANNQGIINAKLKSVLNKIFPFTKKKGNKTGYGITTVNQNLTLGVVALKGTPFKKWNNPDVEINDLKLDYTKGYCITMDAALLKQALDMFEANKEQNDKGQTPIKVLIEPGLPLTLKGRDFAVIIAQFTDEKHKSAIEEYAEIKENLDQIRITEAL